MCRPKPFPRCSNHARKQLVAARARLTEAEAQVGTMTDSTRLDQAREAYDHALKEYETCPENIRNLSNELARLEEAGQADTIDARKTRLMLSSAQARRELLIHNGNLSVTAQKRLDEHATEIADLEARANRDLTPEVLRTEQAALDVEKARDAVTETSNVIAREYAEQGNRSYAWNPGLWALDHETADGERTPAYQAYMTARETLTQAEREFEQARQAENLAKLQVAVDKTNLKHRLAEIGSDLHSGNTYQAYGASMVNPDGTTNARYLTSIPGTSTLYFAKVLKVRDGEAVLETGQRLPLAQANRSDWRYTFPEEGATRGPELYRMDSSG